MHALKRGGGVAVVAPAGPVDPETYAQGLAILARRYRIVRAFEPGRNATTRPYLAADDATRAAWFNDAVADPDVSALFCARGGYGCARILERLDGAALSRRGTPVVGFSDVTAIHAWAACLDVPTIHGPVVTQLPRLPEAHLDALFELLEGGAPPRFTGLRALRGGTARGSLSGGNLTVLTHLLGTRYFPRLAGRILLLEDVGEAPYRIDRMCTQLVQSGALDGLAGAVLGDFSEIDGGPAELIEAIVAERLSTLGVPIAAGAPIGHGSRNLPLPLGVAAYLDVDAGSLTVNAS